MVRIREMERIDDLHFRFTVEIESSPAVGEGNGGLGGCPRTIRAQF